MAKNIVLLLFLALSGFRGVSAPEDYEHYVLQLWCTKGKSAGYGTGTFVSFRGASYILTCYHVVLGYDNISVQNAPVNDITDVRVAWYDSEKDIALLQYRSHAGIRGIPLVSETEENFMYKPAEAVGFPNHMDCNHFKVDITHPRLVSKNVIKTDKAVPVYDPHSPDFKVITFVTNATGGMSGAPVIVDGHMAGMLLASLENGMAFGWGVPVMYFDMGSFCKLNAWSSSPTKLPPLRGYNLALFARHIEVDETELRKYEARIPEANNFVDAYEKAVVPVTRASGYAEHMLRLIKACSNSYSTAVSRQIDDSINIFSGLFDDEVAGLDQFTKQVGNLNTRYQELFSSYTAQLKALPAERYKQIEQLRGIPEEWANKRRTIEKQLQAGLKNLNSNAQQYTDHKTEGLDRKYGIYYVNLLESLKHYNGQLDDFYTAIYNEFFALKAELDFAFKAVGVNE